MSFVDEDSRPAFKLYYTVHVPDLINAAELTHEYYFAEYELSVPVNTGGVTSLLRHLESLSL